MKKVSFIIPCYRSECTISDVIKDIINTVEETEYDYEIICVDDCSPDGVFDVLKELCKKNNKIRAIRFAKNFGQHAGMIAGIHYVTGDYVVFLDDDGQCPIVHLQEMLKPLNEEWDVSIARYGKKKQSLFKNCGSWVHETAANLLIDKPRTIQMSNFMAMKRYIAEEIARYEGPYPHISGLLFRSTVKIINVPMEENARMEGQSTYSVRKLVALWVNSFTAFSIKPLRFATMIGLGSAAVGGGLALVTVVRKLLNPFIAVGWSSLIALMLIIGGLILFVLGIMGEYLGRIYMSITETPQYVIAEKYNFDD